MPLYEFTEQISSAPSKEDAPKPLQSSGLARSYHKLLREHNFPCF